MRRAEEQGVSGMVNCGTQPSDWQAVLDQSARFPNLFPAVGVHPWFCDSLPDDWADQLASLLQQHPGLIVGETGLDALHSDGVTELSCAVFRRQIELAIEFNRPLVVHCVRAWAPLLEILKSFGRLSGGFMLHAFAGSPEIIRELLPLNAWFSFAGSVTRPDNHRVHRAAREVPTDRLLIETDAPDFLPFSITDHSQPNEPAHLPRVLEAMAALRSCSLEDLATITSGNARYFFNLNGVLSQSEVCG